MRQYIVVPDASVILKWALNSPDEDDKDNAIAMLDAWIDGNIDIILPKLWSYEVANVLMMKLPEKALEIMEIFIGYGFNELDMSNELCRHAFDLMQRYKVTFYDAAYHSAAIIMNGTFLTADDAYFNKAKGAAHLMRLSEWR